MTGRPWYAFYPDAYERDASHLSFLQDSAYRRLLDAYYKTGSPLPVDPVALYRMCRAANNAERSAVNSVLAEFFHLAADGKYHNARCDEELQKATEISAKRSGAANKRHANAHANAVHLDTHSTSTGTPSEPSGSSGVTPQAASKPTRKATNPRKPLPEDFPGPSELSSARQAWSDIGRDDLKPGLEAQKFRDHHLSKASKMADWPAAWRTWTSNAPSFTRKESANGKRESAHITEGRAAANLIADIRASNSGANHSAPLALGPELLAPGDDGGPISGSAFAILPRFGGKN